ncbi:DUF6686 family protein [Mucilaginibacter ximonensis]|uniref:DUF6686 family protein n=1 Tax=Mucilaginibacter ximonensis TaxID=538021 RepID=A0ABW5YHF8_9SPHI
MCEVKTLSQRGSTVISQCIECKMLNIWHNNLLFNFTPQQFADFCSFVGSLEFEDRSHPFPDGQERAILKTPVEHLNFTFTKDEWEDMKAAMDEATYMQTVFALIR